MSKIIYIGDQIAVPCGGADQVNLRNQKLFEELFPESITYLSPANLKSNNLFRKFYLGVTDEFVNIVLEELNKGCYDYMFICHSTLGRLAKKVKGVYPDIKIIMFYHNIEIQYAQEYYKTKGIKALPFYFAVKLWEKQAFKYSDYNITLNRRDSNLLKHFYGKDSDLELPTSFDDKFNEQKRVELIRNCNEQIDYLFVGVAFFANIQGVQWLIDNVMPKVSGNLYVIGKGMDHVEFKNLNDRIRIKGFVDDLSFYYYNATCVVSPIFVGGGMKTKTAEALMFGKQIIGTKEAFEGYVIDDSCMCECNTADEFICALERDHKPLKTASRMLFNTYYSTKASLNLLMKFFKDHECRS